MVRDMLDLILDTEQSPLFHGSYDFPIIMSSRRGVLNINDSTGATPSQLSITQNAECLARYASICQQNGLVSFLFPLDGRYVILFFWI